MALSAACAWSVTAQGPNPPANSASQAEVDAGVSRSKFISPYTLKRSGQLTAISNSITQVGNNALAPPRAIAMLSSWDLTQCILTNSSTETIIYEASAFMIGKQVEVVYGAWTNGFSSPNRGEIHAAVGPSLGALTKIGAVLSPGAAGAWDSGYVIPGRIYWENGTNFLTYFGGVGTNGFETAPSSDAKFVNRGSDTYRTI